MKIRNLLTMFLVAATLVGCGTGANSSNDSSTGNSTSSLTNPIRENSVKIRSINASETIVEPVSVKARNKKGANDTEIEDNYIIITKDVTDVQFTITLDNPEAYGIDALRVSCDDPEAQIQVEGEWKPISQEADGTRVVNWSSEDPYEKTYNIRTTSLEDLYTFKVVDIRLSGHDTFLSKQSNSTDFGNNELDIYKMDTDAYTLNVIENTFDYIKFNFNVKDEYKDIISNIRVDGLEMDEDGVYTLTESQEVEISYDYYLEEYAVNVKRNSSINISTIEFGSSSFIDSPLSWMERREYYGVDGIEYISTIEFLLYFYINTEFKLYFDDYEFNNIVYQVNDSGRDKYYSCYVSFDHSDKYVNSTEGFESDEFKKLTKSLELDDSLNPAYHIKITSRDIIVDFLNRFTIVINNISYKFSGTIEEYSTFDGKCYRITSIDTLVRMEDK